MTDIKLYNGDCLEYMDKMIKDDVKVDCIVTDPPYLTTPRGNAGNSGGMMQKAINRKGQVFSNNNCPVSEFIFTLANLDLRYLDIMVIMEILFLDFCVV